MSIYLGALVAIIFIAINMGVVLLANNYKARKFAKFVEDQIDKHYKNLR